MSQTMSDHHAMSPGAGRVGHNQSLPAARRPAQTATAVITRQAPGTSRLCGLSRRAMQSLGLGCTLGRSGWRDPGAAVLVGQQRKAPRLNLAPGGEQDTKRGPMT